MTYIEALRLLLLRSMSRNKPCATYAPLKWNRLRLDRNDGSQVEEYLIEHGQVHRRTKDTTAAASTGVEAQWERVTPDELSSHVTAKTIVAYWLSHKLGPDTLSRACARNGSSPRDVIAKRQQLPRGMAGMFGSVEPITE